MSPIVAVRWDQVMGEWRVPTGVVDPLPDPISVMLATPGATWAHRGGGTNWPEMTKLAYTNSLAAGYGCLEVSLGRTSDGVWFGIHDWTLDRTSGISGSGWVGDRTWEQIQQYQVVLGASGAPQPYMRWEELLPILPPRTILVVDPKDFGNTHMQEFLAMVKADWGTHRTIFKQYGNEVAMANAAAAAGFEHRWGHFYPTNHADGTLAANQGAWTMLGMSYNADQAVWDATNSYGKPTVAHICNTLNAYNTGISRGADMAQCANVLAIPAVTTWLDGGVAAPPPASTWRKPVIGAGGGGDSSFNLLDPLVGPLLARRSYDGALPSSFANSAAASDVAAGRHSFWSWSPALSLKTSTAEQDAFVAFLNTIPAGHKVTIFSHHEPEALVDTLFPTVNEFGQLANIIAPLVRSVGNPNIRYGPCFMGAWTWDTRSPYSFWIQDGATAIDWSLMDVVAIDPYSSIHPNGFSLEDMLTIRNSGSGGGNAMPVMEWLSRFDIPIVIAEWGYYRKQPAGHGRLDPPVDPIPPEVVGNWITDAYAWFLRWNQAHPTRMANGREKGSFIDSALWFNTSLIGADTPLTGPLCCPPVTSGPKIDAYAAIVADSLIRN